MIISLKIKYKNFTHIELENGGVDFKVRKKVVTGHPFRVNGRGEEVILVGNWECEAVRAT